MLDSLSPERFLAGDERWADFSGHRMRYLYLKAQRPTSRPPVVFIHGFFGGAFSWRFNVEEFSRERDVYAIDLLGIADSDRPPRGHFSFTFPDSARRVLGWMRELGLTNVDLIGTSHGGAVSMFIAVLDRADGQNTVGRLVLVDPANPYSRRGRKRIWFFNTAFGAWALKAAGGIDRIKDLSLDIMYGDPKKITQETRAGYRRIVDHPQTYDYSLDVIKTWHADMDTLVSKLPTIADVPTLLIWGEHDVTVPVSSGARLFCDFHGAKLIVLPGAAHMPYEEVPERFNQAVLAYLDARPDTDS